MLVNRDRSAASRRLFYDEHNGDEAQNHEGENAKRIHIREHQRLPRNIRSHQAVRLLLCQCRRRAVRLKRLCGAVNHSLERRISSSEIFR